MEEFLRDYVTMYAEANGEELTEEKLSEVIESLMCDEVIWEVLDEHISYELDN